MRLIDPDHPFYRRPLTRWLTTLAPLAWAGFELSTQNYAWAVIFGAAGLYAGWVLLIANRPGK